MSELGFSEVTSQKIHTLERSSLGSTELGLSCDEIQLKVVLVEVLAHGIKLFGGKTTENFNFRL